jgi:hypothetical protein
LRCRFLDMGNIQHLRNHGKAALHVSLQSLIHEGIPTWEDKKEDLR